MLLNVKSRLEAEVSQVKKEQKRELADKEDELEDTRASAAKRIKNLEQQLEAEHQEQVLAQAPTLAEEQGELKKQGAHPYP